MNLFLFAATILQIITTTKGQAPSQCTVDCAEATCPSNMTDISCFCDHANQTGIISCLQTKCSQAEVQAAQVLQIVICGKDFHLTDCCWTCCRFKGQRNCNWQFQWKCYVRPLVIYRRGSRNHQFCCFEWVWFKEGYDLSSRKNGSGRAHIYYYLDWRYCLRKHVGIVINVWSSGSPR